MSGTAGAALFLTMGLVQAPLTTVQAGDASCVADTVELSLAVQAAIDDIRSKTHTIRLCENTTYNLNAQLPTILSGTSIRIMGNFSTIDGRGVTRIFNLGQEYCASCLPGGKLTLNDVTLTNGYKYGDGGAIRNEAGSVTLINSMITNSVSRFGGGIMSRNGAVTLNNSTISGNVATNFGVWPSSGGGGVYAYGSEVALNKDSSITENSTTGWGGGVLWGMVYVNKSSVTCNTALVNGDSTHNSVVKVDKFSTVSDEPCP